MHPEQSPSLKPFFVLWGGQAVSLLGSQLVQFALIWWLTQETGSATILAIASLVGLLPHVVLGPFVGVLVDRWNRRLTMLAADSVVALATVLLAYLFWIDVIQVWQVLVILFVRSLGGGFHGPAMQSSTALMVPDKHLTRVQGLNQTLNGGLNIVSAPLGALLLSLLPVQGVLAIDVVTALFAIVPLFFIAVPQPRRSDTDLTEVTSSFWADMEAGFRYVWNWPAILMLMGMATLINFLLSPASSLMPLLVTEHFQGNAFDLSAIQAALGVGVVLGGLLLSTWGGFHKRIHTSQTALAGLGVGVLLIGFAPASLFWMAVVGGFAVGMMSSMANGPIMAIFQANIEPAMQGRVFTLLSSLAMGMTPLGLLIAGPVADVLGVQTWYIVGGFVSLLLGIAGFFIPALMGIEDGRSRPPFLPDDVTTAVAD